MGTRVRIPLGSLSAIREKRACFENLLAHSYATVLFDPRAHTETSIPSHLKSESFVALQYGYNMPVPIRDLDISDQGISATLSFGTGPHWTFVPWDAVFAMSDGEQALSIWEECVPADFPRMASPPPDTKPTPIPSSAKKPPTLKLVK